MALAGITPNRSAACSRGSGCGFFTPVESPCTPGGNSIIHEMDAKDGSRLLQPVFDINSDGSIDQKDMIEIYDPVVGKILVAPTGTEIEGHLQAPAILNIGETEIKYMSSSSGNIEMIREKAVRLGISTWQEF